jgi:hypothetical protein
MLKIIVDGDSCPVVNQTIKIAKENNLELLIVKNHNHYIQSDYGEIVSVESTKDSADLYIVNNTDANDIIISQDYGLAAMVLARNGRVVHPNGIIITENNIDTLLHQRFISSQLRRQKRHFGSKNKKRTESLNENFINTLKSLIKI